MHCNQIPTSELFDFFSNVWFPCSLSPLSAYVLQVKVEMELEIQQSEKTKAVREEQLERLTQICQEQAVSPNKKKKNTPPPQLTQVSLM